MFTCGEMAAYRLVERGAPVSCVHAAEEEMDDEARGIEGMERQVLQKRIGEPLAAVQTLMQRDKVIWERGLLSTPPVRPRRV